MSMTIKTGYQNKHIHSYLYTYNAIHSFSKSCELKCPGLIEVKDHNTKTKSKKKELKNYYDE